MAALRDPFLGMFKNMSFEMSSQICRPICYKWYKLDWL